MPGNAHHQRCEQERGDDRTDESEEDLAEDTQVEGYAREVMADFRSDGTAEKPPSEVKIELPVDAHLPHDYVPGERLRLEAYKKLATVEAETGSAGA